MLPTLDDFDLDVRVSATPATTGRDFTWTTDDTPPTPPGPVYGEVV
jgi:hypothetical protein